MRVGIGTKTAGAMLLLGVPSLLTLSWLVLRAAAALLQERTETHIATLAETSARNLDDLVGRSRSAALAVAESPVLQEALAAAAAGRKDPEPIRHLEASFEAFQRLEPEIQAIRVVDRDGNVVVKVREGKVIRAAARAPGPLGLDAITSVRGRPFFEEALRLPRGEVFVSDLERGRVDGEESWCPGMVRFATPLFLPSGARAGVVIVNVWSEAVGTMINRLVPHEQGTAFLVERNARDPERSGIYLFHPDRQCEFGNQTGTRVTAWQQYPREVVDGWMRTASGLVTDPASGDLLAHVYASPFGRDDHGWVIVLVARHDFFARPLARLEGRVLTLAGLVLLGIVAGSVVFSRTLARPLRELVEGVRRIGHDLSARVPVRGRDEIGTLSESVNRMAAELEAHLAEKARAERHLRETEKLASVGEMAAGLAHELNTPLANIRALAALARKDLAGGLDPEALGRDLDDIGEQTRRCAAIIEGLLRFARRDPPALARHDVNCLLGASIDLVRLRAEKKRVAISFRRDAPPMPVVADGPQLEQVFVNLLLNAVDAVPDGGRVEVAAEQQAGRVRVQVRDEGPGIPAEHLSRIFDPFFTTKEVGTGTGLGLSVSYGIVRSHGGDIDVESGPGRGATFTVSLPEAA